MSKILMVVFNTFEHDARVERAAKSLATAGYEVAVICSYAAHLPCSESTDGYQIARRCGAPCGGGGASSSAVTRHERRLLSDSIALATRVVAAGGRAFVRHLASPTRVPFLRSFIARRSFKLRRAEIVRLIDAVVTYNEEFGADMVHAHDFKAALAAHEIHRKHGTPYVYDSHELWLERNRAGLLIGGDEISWERAGEQRIVADAAATITVCESIAAHLAAQYKIERPVVVRNIPEQSNDGLQVSRQGRSELGFESNDFLLLYAGKATFGRGLLDTLDALALTPARVKLLVVGYFDDDFSRDFWAKVTALGLNSRVRAHGPVQPGEVVATLSLADLSLVTINAVSLSYRYALPNKLMESIHAGVPVVGTDLPEISRIIHQYQCGETIRDGDRGALADLINRLAASPEVLAQYRAGAVRAAQALTWANEAPKLRAVYEKIMPLQAP